MNGRPGIFDSSGERWTAARIPSISAWVLGRVAVAALGQQPAEQGRAGERDEPPGEGLRHSVLLVAPPGGPGGSGELSHPHRLASRTGVGSGRVVWMCRDPR